MSVAPLTGLVTVPETVPSGPAFSCLACFFSFLAFFFSFLAFAAGALFAFFSSFFAFFWSFAGRSSAACAAALPAGVTGSDTS